MPLEKFYTDDPRWHAKIGDIHALLERVKISEEQSWSVGLTGQDVRHPRRLSRILSIHASTAIEGNRLTLGQVTDVINGKPDWGPPKDIKEVQNAWQAGYGAFAVSQSNVPAVRDYVARQQEHHRRKSFQEEYRAFLERHGVAYDEQYVRD